MGIDISRAARRLWILALLGTAACGSETDRSGAGGRPDDEVTVTGTGPAGPAGSGGSGGVPIGAGASTSSVTSSSGATGGEGPSSSTGARSSSAASSSSASSSAGTGGASPTCGDGVKNQAFEQCDGGDLGGATCAALVDPQYVGVVGCQASCIFDTSGCVCVPSCGGKQCGSDGCGGSCGACSGGTSCQSGQCVCAASCSLLGYECGVDGCGQSCGSCASGEFCLQGSCQSCAPSCNGKACGSNGCGGVCGACGGNEKCSANQCTACTQSCPNLTPVSGNSTTCLARLEDCSTCGPASCGTAHYAYGCFGAVAPALPDCYQYSGTDYCCSQAACLRYTVADSYCTQLGLPPQAYSCHLGASPSAGCVIYPGGNSEAPVYCCP